MSLPAAQLGRSGLSRHPDTGTGSDSRALRRLLAECSSAGIERHALWLRLSLLPSISGRPHHQRLARAALDPLLNADRARLFRLPGADLVAAWRGEASAAEQTCRESINHLFADVTLPVSSTLLETLLLPRDAIRLAQAIDLAESPVAALQAPPCSLPPLDTVTLSALEARLARADMARFARRRDVCAINTRDLFELHWEQRFLCMSELSETLSPDRDVRADAWLFRRLTRTLDRRMLALLAAPGELDGAGPFALSLNVGGILAPEFLKFDAALPTGLRGRIILELSAIDVFADSAAFSFARDFAHTQGYRLLLRADHKELLDLVPPAMSGFDLVQLRWSRQLLATEELPCSPAAMVLSGVDTPDALAWGRARGINLFQGAQIARGSVVSHLAFDPEPL